MFVCKIPTASLVLNTLLIYLLLDGVPPRMLPVSICTDMSRRKQTAQLTTNGDADEFGRVLWLTHNYMGL